MAGNAFMSGLIKGFMAFGGGGMMGGAGAGGGEAAAGAGGSAGAGAGDAGGMAGGLMGGTSSATPTMGTSTGASAASGVSGGGENVGTTSQALSTGGGSSGGGGDIIRENPYGSGSTTPANAGPTDTQKFGKSLMDIGKNQAEQAGKGGSTSMPGSTYQALFGGGGAAAFQTGMSGGGQMGMGGGISVPAAAPIQTPPIPMAQVTAPTALPSPMPLQMSSPQVPTIPPVNPVLPQAQLGVSDMRAKQNIKYANADMDRFLSTVYDNISKRKK